MRTLADLVEELEELGVRLDEITIPYRLYRQLIDFAEQLAEADEEDSEA